MLVLAALLAGCGGGGPGAAPAARASGSPAEISATGAGYRPGVVLVKFRTPLARGEDGALRLRTLEARTGISLRTERSFPFIGVDVQRIQSGQPVPEVVDKLRALDDVEYAEPDYACWPAEGPEPRLVGVAPPGADLLPPGNDPWFPSQWGLQNTGQSGGLAGADIEAPAAWDTTTGSSNVVVAVIDTGVRYDHEDLAASMWTNPGEIPGNGVDDDGNGYVDDVYGINAIDDDGDPMDDPAATGSGHGTHVAATIAAPMNGKGGVGVAPGVRIMALRFLANPATTPAGGGYNSDAIQCIDYCIAKGARLSNNSWGSTSYSQSVYDAIARARDAGQLFVAAAGNGGSDQVGDDNDVTPYYPCGYDLANVLSVGNSTRSEALAASSNYGATSVDLFAPGTDIVNAYNSSTSAYVSMTGTSMATPHVAGVLALMLSKSSSQTYSTLKTRLLGSVEAIAAYSGKCVTGGRLNAKQALAAIPEDPPAAPSALGATVASSTQVDLAWTDNSANETGFKIERKTGAGAFAQVGTVGAGVTTWSNTGLTSDTAYTWRVRATNAGGDSSYSNEASATPPGLPAAPTGLTATVNGPDQVFLTWTDNATNETGYRVERKVGAGSFVEVASLSAGANNLLSVGLTSDTTYTWRVRAVNAGGFSGYSNEASATPPRLPGAPSGLGATVASPTRVDLAWTDNATNETGFKIERKTGAGAFAQVGTAGAGVTTWSDTGLTADTAYTWRVRATNAGGDSGYSNEASATPPSLPAAPTGLTATVASSSQVNLAWTDNATNETGYRLERKAGAGSFVEVASLSAGLTSFISTGLTPDTTYTWRVRAVNAGGFSAYSNEASATPPGLPAAPSGLAATVVSPTRVDLAWTDNAANETGFKIERRAGAGSFAQVATVGAGVSTWSDTGLTADTAYTWRVRATNAGGDSSYSNEASATPPSLPAAPTGLAATVASSTQVNLAWTDNAANETGFKIERRTGAGSFAEVGTVGAGVTSWSNTGLTADTAYTWRVRATNAGGDSSYSNEASATPPGVPGAPTSLGATVLSSTGVALSWTDNATNEAGFQIERKSGAGSFAQVATVGAGVTTWSDTGLTADTAYTWRVRAWNAGGTSGYSNEASATPPRAPGAPSGLGATAVSYTQVDLAWTDNATNETGFRIERKLGAGSFAVVATVGAGVTRYSDTGRTPGETYTWRVYAFNAGGDSEASNEASATLPAEALTAPSRLTATRTGGRAVLRWSDNSGGETGFRVERKLGAGAFEALVEVGAGATTATDPAPAADQACTYRVRAFSANGTSGWSNEAVASTSTTRLLVGLGGRGQGWLEAFDVAADGEPLHASWHGVPWPSYGTPDSSPTAPAAGDVDGDGRDELVVGLGPQGQGRVCVLDDASAGHALLGWVQVTWAAYNGSGDAPTWPACADLDGDGLDEIVVGLGPNGQGHAQVFQAVGGGQFQPYPVHGGWLRVQWDAYGASGNAPTYPAGGDFNADGRDEVVLGLGGNGAGWSQAFTLDGAAFVPYAGTAPFSNSGWVPVGWTAYATSGDAPAYPAAADLDQDGKDDLVLGLGGHGAGWVQVYRSTGVGFEAMPGTPTAGGWLRVPWPAYQGASGAATWPTCGDLDGDGGADLVLGLGDAGQGWAWGVLGKTFTAPQGASFQGWLQVRWGAYVTGGAAPTRPVLLNEREAPVARSGPAPGGLLARWLERWTARLAGA